MANIPLDACVHTRFPRTRETAEIALGERVDVPLVVEPLLDDIDIGDLEGEPLETIASGSTVTTEPRRFPAARASTTPRAGMRPGFAR